MDPLVPSITVKLSLWVDTRQFFFGDDSLLRKGEKHNGTSPTNFVSVNATVPVDT